VEKEGETGRERTGFRDVSETLEKTGSSTESIPLRGLLTLEDYSSSLPFGADPPPTEGFGRAASMRLWSGATMEARLGSTDRIQRSRPPDALG
jgi:hypothetical protein